MYFSLRDGALGTPLLNQSITSCFSILQQDQVEFTLGPLPADVESITFSLTQQTNETTMLTLVVSWLQCLGDWKNVYMVTVVLYHRVVFAIIVHHYTFPKLTTVKTFHARLPFRNSIVLPSHVMAPFTCSDAAASDYC